MAADVDLNIDLRTFNTVDGFAEELIKRQGVKADENQIAKRNLVVSIQGSPLKQILDTYHICTQLLSKLSAEPIKRIRLENALDTFDSLMSKKSSLSLEFLAKRIYEIYTRSLVKIEEDERYPFNNRFVDEFISSMGDKTTEIYRIYLETFTSVVKNILQDHKIVSIKSWFSKKQNFDLPQEQVDQLLSLIQEPEVNIMDRLSSMFAKGEIKLVPVFPEQLEISTMIETVGTLEDFYLKFDKRFLHPKYEKTLSEVILLHELLVLFVKNMIPLRFSENQIGKIADEAVKSFKFIPELSDYPRWL